jgi:hypothetical protein
MDATAGRFEKRFILESLFADKAPVLLSYGGKKSRVRILEVGADFFRLDAGAEATGSRVAQDYLLDIAFRGLLFRACGEVLSNEASSLRIAFHDRWELLSSPAATPPLPGFEPSISLAFGDRQLAVAFARPSGGIAASDAAALQAQLDLLESSVDSELRFRLSPQGAPRSALDRVLISSGKRLAVFDPPLSLPETCSSHFLSFPFLGLSEYESLIAIEGGQSGVPPEPGIYAALALGRDCYGLFRFAPRRVPFVSLEPADLFRLLFVEAFIRSFSTASASEPDLRCLSLQADGIALSSRPGSAVSGLKEIDSIRVLLSFPERDIAFSASAKSVLSSGAGLLSILVFSGGNPEDFRFLFERLYGLPFDGEIADYLMKKAAP